MYQLFYILRIILNNLKSRLVFKKVGKMTYIFSPLRVVGGKYICFGNKTSVMKGLRIEAIDRYNDKMYRPEIYIGDRVNIEQNVHITCASKILIGADCSILANVLITDITHPYEDITRAPRDADLVTSPVSIGEQTMIGMGAKIMPGISIGKHCVVGANAVVTKSVADYSVVAGIPARVIKRYDEQSKKWITLNSK